MTYPKLSIVTPNYNMGRFLERTIQSVLGQNYPNLEYIIIDGGSNDGSVEIIKKYESKLAAWCSEPDGGLYDAVNKGFSLSTGEIMAWLNSDDIYLPGALTIIANVFERFKDVNWITSNHAYINEVDEIIYTQCVGNYNRYDFFTGEVKWIQQESTFWRRSLWEKTGGCLDINYSLASDYELWCRFFQHDQIYKIETCLSGFRVRDRDQKSNEGIDEYLRQISQIRRRCTLDSQEKYVLKSLNRYKRIADRIPFSKFFLTGRINDLQEKVNSRLPTISFDRFKYKFELK